MDRHEPETRRPNVVLVLVDDMGFADIGAMGSEILSAYAAMIDRLDQSLARLVAHLEELGAFARCSHSMVNHSLRRLRAPGGGGRHRCSGSTRAMPPFELPT